MLIIDFPQTMAEVLKMSIGVVAYIVYMKRKTDAKDK